MQEPGASTGRMRVPSRQIGRYGIFDQIAAGGMATIHLARLAGPVGFSRVVAVKHLHPHLSMDPQFKSMFIDEARLAARVRHPNVVQILDVVVSDAELFLVLEYVQGEALSALRKAARRQNQAIPLPICSAIMVGVLQGLHAAHEARDENGAALNLVHRDVSPPNILVGVDGIPMVLDFGVAKAVQTLHHSRPGVVKGKSAYMAPEQIRGEAITRRTDIFSASVVLWELLAGHRLFGGGSEQERMYRVLQGTNVIAPSNFAPHLPSGLDEVVLKGLRPDPAERFETALEMAEALERLVTPASQRMVGGWVARTAAETLARRAEAYQLVESSGVPVVVAVPDSGSLSMETPATPPPVPAVDPAADIPTPPPVDPSPPAWSWRSRKTQVVVGLAATLAAGIWILALVSRPRAVPRPAPAAARAPAAAPDPLLRQMSREEAELERLRAVAPHRLGEWPARAGKTVRTRPVTARKPAPGDDGSEAAPAVAPGGESAAPVPEQSGEPGKKRVPLVDDRPRLKILE
jgi:serine/threonine-protein kinase